MSKTHLDISKHAGGRIHEGPLLASRGMKPSPMTALVRQFRDITNSIRKIKIAMVDRNYADAIKHFETAKQKYNAGILKCEGWSSIRNLFENLDGFFQSPASQFFHSDDSARDKSLREGVGDLKKAMDSEDDITCRIYRRNTFVLLRVFTHDEIISTNTEPQKKDEVFQILRLFCPFQYIEENLQLLKKQ